jgi:NAD(P)-dependent dehydrogenase (short-subunit alcohol dehydrogenase family)
MHHVLRTAELEGNLMALERGVAIVTGAGRGLGRAFAIALAEQGFKVAATARTEAEINETAEVIMRSGGHAIAIPGDVTERRAVEHVVTMTEARLGPIDVLVNNAGQLHALGQIGAVDPDVWWREMEINLRGPLLFANAVLPGMSARGQGRILNLASGAGLSPIATGSAYCASKAALIRLTEAIALETQDQGIVTFAVDPGFVRTPMTEYVTQSDAIRGASPDVAAAFDQLLADGKDTPIARPVELLLTLAAGKVDALSGCFLTVNDDLDALLAQTEAIQREERLRLRLAV